MLIIKFIITFILPLYNYFNSSFFRLIFSMEPLLISFGAYFPYHIWTLFSLSALQIFILRWGVFSFGDNSHILGQESGRLHKWRECCSRSRESGQGCYLTCIVVDRRRRLYLRHLVSSPTRMQSTAHHT